MDPNATTVRMPTLSNERAAASANAASSSTNKTKTDPPTTAPENIGGTLAPYLHTMAERGQNNTAYNNCRLPRPRRGGVTAEPVKSWHRRVSGIGDGKATPP